MFRPVCIDACCSVNKLGVLFRVVFKFERSPVARLLFPVSVERGMRRGRGERGWTRCVVVMADLMLESCLVPLFCISPSHFVVSITFSLCVNVC